VAVQSKAWAYIHVLGGTAELNPTGSMDVWALVCVVYCQVEVSAMG
jgi:hypothetical protein